MIIEKIAILIIACYSIHSEIIYIIPPAGYEHEVLFTCVEHDDKILNRDNCVKHFYDLRTELRKLGHDLKTSMIASLPINSIVITSGIPDKEHAILLRERARKIITFIWEPITIEPQSYSSKHLIDIDIVFTMWDDQIDNKKIFKLYYPNPTIFLIDDIPPFHTKKMLTMIAANGIAHYNINGELYSERRRAIDYFTNHMQNFTFYGRGGWNAHQKGYGGLVENKEHILKNYKFCICFENTKNMNGYVTEKIFDCMHAGCIPIYLGAPNITQYVPADCFIDMRNFKNYEELQKFIMHMSEETYAIYIKNIKQFLSSENAKLFSIENFVRNAIDSIFK